MQAHAIIDALKNHKQYDSIVNDLFKAEKFELDFGEHPKLTTENFKQHLSHTKIPYPLCYFEIPKLGSVLAQQDKPSDRFIKLQIFPYFIEDGWSLYNPSFEFAIDLIQSTFVSLSTNTTILEEFDKTCSDVDNFKKILVVPMLVVEGLSVLNCSNVIFLDNEPSVALNKKRRKNDKCPLFTYKTLHVDLGKSRIVKPNQGGSHANPRLHLRRGHIRRYETHSIWIENMMVGSVSKGVVVKDYKVTD